MTPEQQLEIKEEFNAIVAENKSKLKVIEDRSIALLKQIQFDTGKNLTKLEKLTKMLVKIIIIDKGLDTLNDEDETFEDFMVLLAVQLMTTFSGKYNETELFASFTDELKAKLMLSDVSIADIYSEFKDYKISSECTIGIPLSLLNTILVGTICVIYSDTKSDITRTIPYDSFDMFLKCNIRGEGMWTYYIGGRNKEVSIKDNYNPVNNPRCRLMLRYDTDNNILANLYFLEVWDRVKTIVLDMEFYTTHPRLELMQGLVAAMMRVDGIEVNPNQLDLTPSLNDLSARVGKATAIKANRLFDFIKVVKDPDIITLIEDESLIFNWFAYYSSNKDTIYGIDPEVRLYQYRLMSSILQYAHSTGTITLAQVYCEALYNFDNHLEYQIAIRDLCMSKGDNLDTIVAKLQRHTSKLANLFPTEDQLKLAEITATTRLDELSSIQKELITQIANTNITSISTF